MSLKLIRAHPHPFTKESHYFDIFHYILILYETKRKASIETNQTVTFKGKIFIIFNSVQCNHTLNETYSFPLSFNFGSFVPNETFISLLDYVKKY